MTAEEFEAFARDVMSARHGARLPVGWAGGVHKAFDFVSPDGTIVGDAKFLTLVNRSGIPSAKFPNIAEHVRLLEKTGARHRFLVFGNHRRVLRL